MSDRAIVIVRSCGQVTENTTTEEPYNELSRGTKTVEFLFQLGAEYLARYVRSTQLLNSAVSFISLYVVITSIQCYLITVYCQV